MPFLYRECLKRVDSEEGRDKGRVYGRKGYDWSMQFRGKKEEEEEDKKKKEITDLQGR